MPSGAALADTAAGAYAVVGNSVPASLTGAPGDASRGSRPVYFESTKGFVETPVLERARLAPGFSLIGPAVLEQIDCTTVIEPGQTATVDDHGNLVIVVGRD